MPRPVVRHHVHDFIKAVRIQLLEHDGDVADGLSRELPDLALPAEVDAGFLFREWIVDVSAAQRVDVCRIARHIVHLNDKPPTIHDHLEFAC